LWAADEITGLNDLDGIPTWPDTSGNGEDLLQPTGPLQMLYSNSTVTQNGLPVVFSGASNFMSDGSSASPRVSYSIYIACSYDTSEAAYQDLLRTANEVPQLELHGNVWTSFPPGANGRVGFGSWNAVASYPDAIDGAQILSFHLDKDAETAEIYRGTSLISTGLVYSVSGAEEDANWTIGWAATDHDYNGFYFEIRIYRGGVHTAGERNAIIGELSTKWGI
jgi:hypothetical protein